MNANDFNRLLRSNPRPISNDDFLRAVFANMDPAHHTIVAAVRGDPTAPDLDRRVWAGRPWQPGRSLGQYLAGDVNTYLTVSSFAPDSNGRRRRIKAAFKQLHCVMVDDVGPKVDPSRIAVAPSAAIETSPGNVQLYYLLRPTAASCDLGMASAFIDALVEHGLAQAADPGMRGVTRFGRLPVGTNGKAKYGPGGFPHRLKLWRPERTYTLEELARAYDIGPLRAARPRRSAELTPAERKRFGKQFMAVLDYFERTGRVKSFEPHAGKYDVSCPWLDEHTDHADTGTALFVPSDANDGKGGFRCHHGHCERRNLWDVKALAQASAVTQVGMLARKSGTLTVSK